jgi:hypothetical protein
VIIFRIIQWISKAYLGTLEEELLAKKKREEREFL